jgi:hypothetical protein
MPILRTFGSVLLRVVAPIIVFGTALYGIVEGIMETADEWKKYFQGFWDLGKAIIGITTDLVTSIPYIKQITDGLMTFAKFVGNLPIMLLKMIAGGWQKIAGWLGIAGGKQGEMMSDLAKLMHPKSFEDPKTKDKDPSKKTSVSVPTIPEYDDESTLQVLGEQMKGMDQASRDKMQGAIEGAMASPANGGGFIDPEEFASFEAMLTKAFDSSKNLQELVKEAKAKQGTARASQRG